MIPFSNKETTDYYNQTLNHYTLWWKLSGAMALHFGFWLPGTKTFVEALRNTNREMAWIAEICPDHLVLDAGCGVGGAAFYLAKNFGCNVTGITLSQKHLDYAEKSRQSSNEKDLIVFDLQDFTKTTFRDNTFDFVWACESLCHADLKTQFIDEVFRVLKPSGKLILSDYFLSEKGIEDKNRYIRNWGESWAISSFITETNFLNEIVRCNFRILQNLDFMKEILPSSKRMYLAYLFGIIP